jgi:ABC-type branched-subunit amino acid transport system ATPase component
VARAGIARTYQTTQLFGSLSVIDNVLMGLKRGRLGNPFLGAASPESRRDAEGLLAFVGYKGALGIAAADLPHVDRRLVEIARALATRPSVLLLDEPAAGLMYADKAALTTVLRRLADTGLAVILVEHDMTLVMGISDHIVVLDAGRPIASGTAETVRHDAKVREAYLGSGEIAARPRAVALPAQLDRVLAATNLEARYGALPVLGGITFEVRRGELVALLGANGAGKSTTMRALSGLLRPVSGSIALAGNAIERREAHAIVGAGLILVPEGRQVFPELTVRDNLLLGAHARGGGDLDGEIADLVRRFPRLADKLDRRAGLLSGGEQQMLAIARALLLNPTLLIMDEPSEGLAPAVVESLLDTIRSLHEEGTALLVVEQKLGVATALAERQLVMVGGEIAVETTATELNADADAQRRYLGVEPVSS